MPATESPTGVYIYAGHMAPNEFLNVAFMMGQKMKVKEQIGGSSENLNGAFFKQKCCKLQRMYADFRSPPDFCPPPPGLLALGGSGKWNVTETVYVDLPGP